MSKIIKVKARQVFDSRGNPTVEAEVYVKNNSATAICPSGASTGTFEAYEKRDNKNKQQYKQQKISRQKCPDPYGLFLTLRFLRYATLLRSTRK